MENLTEFVTNNLILFAALLGVMVMLIKAELDHQGSKGSLLSPAKAIRLMNNSQDALIVDVRSVADFKKGHIKGSKNTPLSEFSGVIDKYKAYKDKDVLVYCYSGNTATRAIKLLRKAGFEKVNNLQGGISAWKEANMPLTKR